MMFVSWVLLCLVARLLERTWWSPASLLALVLAVSTIGTAVFAPEYYISTGAVLMLQAFTTVVLLGSLLAQLANHRVRRTPRSGSGSLTIARLPALFSLGLLASLASLFYTLRAAQAGLGDLFDLDALFSVAQATTRERYTEGLDFPIVYNIANALTLTYAMVVGADAGARRRLKPLLALPVLIYALGNILITTRAPIVILLLLATLSAVFGYSSASRQNSFPPMFKGRPLRVLAAGGGGVAAIFFGFQLLRFGSDSTRSVAEVWDHLRRWPWGSVPGFSLWWDGQAPQEEGGPVGFYTFMGVLDNLGVAERIPGGYAGYVRLTNNEPGNIYTAFRGLIEDATLPGALLALAVLGMLSGVAVSAVNLSWRTRLTAYVGVGSFFAFSWVVSLWSFSANVIAILLIPVFYKLFGDGPVGNHKRQLQEGSSDESASSLRKLYGISKLGSVSREER